MELVGTESSLVRQLKVAIKGDMQPRYSNPEIDQFLIISSAMDPRFKSLPQLNDERRHEITDAIILKAVSHSQNKSHVKCEPTEPVQPIQQPAEVPVPALPALSTTPLPQPSTSSLLPPSPEDGPSTSSGTGSTIKNLFGDAFITKVEPGNRSPLDQATNEVNAYFNEPVIGLDSNPLKWWMNNGYKYPMLSNIAKYYLTVPGTSVPSERVFSTAGDIVTSQRSCLNPEDVDKLIFLKKNLNL